MNIQKRKLVGKRINNLVSKAVFLITVFVTSMNFIIFSLLILQQRPIEPALHLLLPNISLIVLYYVHKHIISNIGKRVDKQ